MLNDSRVILDRPHEIIGFLREPLLERSCLDLSLQQLDRMYSEPHSRNPKPDSSAATLSVIISHSIVIIIMIMWWSYLR